ncbi:MAG: ubiquinol oxidase subunit II [Gammaproteobacteria bacterium]
MKGKKYLISLIVLCEAVLLSGCSNAPLLNPKGPIGSSELFVIGVAFVLMLIVVIPVIVMTVWFPRRYKASNPKGDYAPKWSYSRKIEMTIWLVPAAIVIALGVLTWKETHRLDPFEPLESTVEPVNIEAVSLDWKWLFIYPQQKIATVNQLVFPVNVPVSFTITSDTVVTSFFIPQLGSQIYAMGGKKSRLHLLADEPGIYAGQNQQFSGRGFPDMNFKVRVTSQEQFNAWVQKTKQAPNRLDLAQLEKLRKPSTKFPATSYSWVKQGLFDDIVNKYHAASMNQSGAYQAKSEALERKTMEDD